MTLPSPRHLLLALVLASVSLPAAATPARVERLTDLITRMLPIGDIFALASRSHPNWPVQGVEDRVDAGQVACLRDELSPAGYRRVVRTRVVAYAGKYPDRVASDITLLEGGAADLFGRLVMAGAEGETTGVPPDPEAMLAEASPEQLASFETFFGSPEHADLREVVGLGDALSPEKSAEENEAAGEQLGNDFASKLMLRAIDTCGVQL